MTNRSLNLTIDSKYHDWGKHFLDFIQNVARRYPVRLSYRSLERGKFYVKIEGSPDGKIDALFQELIINKGLYYYVCTIKDSNKRTIINNAIIPIYQELIESRFENPYSRFLRRHILGKISQNRFIPGDLLDEFSHGYEVLFRKWDIGVINDWDFIKDTDSLLTRFLLIKNKHTPGARSKEFSTLLNKVRKQGIAMTSEIEVIFIRVHKARTMGLHRLKDILSKKKIIETAIQLYNYFQYYDEFQESQKPKMIIINGRKYKRIRYGNEVWFDQKGHPLMFKKKSGEPMDQRTIAKKRSCGDCEAVYGQLHCFGCDWEQCPRCKRLLLGCMCKIKI